jgi:ABC-type branched-subunit amino acid transport system permease subunit
VISPTRGRAIQLGINIVLALSLALPVSAGLLSLGQGGFMAIGAYLAQFTATPAGRGPWRSPPPPLRRAR